MNHHEVIENAGGVVRPRTGFAYLVYAVAEKSRALLFFVEVDTNAFFQVKDD
jgi:hypothetical protein